MSVPSPADAALRALASALVPYLPAAGAPGRPYSQLDGERPPGAGRVKYLRAWRRARAAGDPGAWAEGRARLMAPEAWVRWSHTERRRPVKATPAVGPSVLDELGARRVAP